jgi:hypothetical protein
MAFRRIAIYSMFLAVAAIPALGAAIPVGDVVVAVGNGSAKVFSPTGVLLETLNDGSNSSFTTGMVFDASDNLYVTNFDTPTISKFDASGNLVASSFMTASNTPESILVTGAGNFLVGGPGAASFLQYSAAGGSPTNTFNVAGGNGTGGTDWGDLEADQQTLLYDGEGTQIKTFNLATNTQGPLFATAPNTSVFEFRIIPSGPLAGDVIAADTTDAILFNSSGTLIRTYTLPGISGADFALNLDPDGVDFWTADDEGNVWEVNLASGAIVEQWNSGAPGLTFGLVVNGQITAAGPPPPPPPPSTTPEPSSILLLGTGLLGLGGTVKRKFLS